MHCAICQAASDVTRHTFWYVRDDEIPTSVQDFLKMYRGDADVCARCVAQRGEKWQRVAPKAARITALATFGLVAVVLPVLMLTSTPRPSAGELIFGTVLLGLFAGGALGGGVLLGLRLRSKPKRAIVDLLIEHRERFGVVGCSGFWFGERPVMVTLNGRNWRVNS
ncbi:MAG: hypothetical protein HY824_07100 [Acidobacteria bacterium]|nr:hypothetical protein [Acidobacteriota bacterium]